MRRTRALKTGPSLDGHPGRGPPSDAGMPGREVSVREIAEAAGVSHVVIYRYFEGKEHLRRAVIDEVMAEVTARTQKGDDGEQTLRRAVDAALDVSPDFRILAFSVLTGDSRSAFSTPPVMAALLQQLRTQRWRSPPATSRWSRCWEPWCSAGDLRAMDP